MPAFTKRELIVEVSNRTGKSQQEVSDILHTTLECVMQQLSKGQDVSLRRFGTFRTKLKQARQAHKPDQPEDKFQVPARASVRFRPSQEMRDRVQAATPTLQRRD